MRKAFLAASLFALSLPLSLVGLFTGPSAEAADLLPNNSRPAVFSGALSYDSLTVPERSGTLSAGDFSVDLYKSEIGPIGLSLGTGFSRGDEGRDADNYMVGLRFDYGGLSVASQWRGVDDGVCGMSETLCEAGPAWNIGATYNTGAASLSAGYQAMNPLGSDERAGGGDVFRFGIDYQLFDGVSSRADAYYIDGNKGLVAGDSTVVLIGTRITF